ncbi:metallophosphoesterase [Halorubrum halophilum]|uniref:metallophosphoesterase n=1 Tax=Halorubrum halophilum TaxID=413816 RepID=UPI0009E2C345|nr:metallophosphoesterase [Halorubrum halophilum]
MPLSIDGPSTPPSLRHGVHDVATESETPPPIVSISDIHGHLAEARSALQTLTDHPEFDPIVRQDDDGCVHWAGNNYVLVFNGDLVDRGPENEGVLALVSRLIEEAPPGRVRVTLGNHEAFILSPDHFNFERWFAGQVATADRLTFFEAISEGHVVAAYEGYNYTYAHAGSPNPYETDIVNTTLIDAVNILTGTAGTPDDAASQRTILDTHDRVLGIGHPHPKGSEAGLVWLDFEHLPADAPPQIVGHTRHDEPQQKGNVFCQNVLRNNLSTPGGEGVFIETPHSLSALIRREDSETVELALVNPEEGWGP